MPNKSLILDIGSTPDKNSNHFQKKDQKIEMVPGRAQVHGEDFSKETEIVIGFDFGTSSSKIVIRDFGLRTAYAVPFGSLACSGNSYLVPTRIFINDEGDFNLSPDKYLYENLKINLMDSPKQAVFIATKTAQSITTSDLASAYMALVIRFARAWFLKKTESIYEKTDIQWHINVGIPSKNYDELEKREACQAIAMAAGRI